jgi:hypothetical protein
MIRGISRCYGADMIGQAAFELIETSALSRWLRESESLFAFPGVLILHTLGMAMLAGVSAAVSLRLLGVARGVPLNDMKAFVPMAWVGFAMNAISGVLLVIAYPAKALTNPVFYVKLALIVTSVALLARMTGQLGVGDNARSAVATRSARGLAIASLVLWMLTIVAGRLLPYTYRYLLSSEGVF